MARKPKPNPHSDEPGFIASRRNPRTTQDVVLYDNRQAGFKKKARYVAVCIEHGFVVDETNLMRAKKLLRSVDVWCEHCRNLQDNLEVVVEDDEEVHTTPFEFKSTEEQKRELRVWANTVKGNPEKCALFERLYGMKPDDYWD